MKASWLLLLLAFTATAAAHNGTAVAQAAESLTANLVRYDGSYFAIDYPGGDVPVGVGVCTDVVVRAYRKLGFDLQVAVHEDMSANFARYPSKRIWGLTQPDPNIDHRRVPNLQQFFSRFGQVLPIDQVTAHYLAGDIVTWQLPGNLPHIGIVSSREHPVTARPLIVHNIGAGQVLEDMLFEFPISGHFRFEPPAL